MQKSKVQTNSQKLDFDPQKFEPKWQEKWESNNTFSPDINSSKKPFYNLMMFPYPSAEGLHVGNMYAFTGADVYGRFNRMRGNQVFEPIGLDGFGIHSENYALKVGKHPQEQSRLSQANFYRQLRSVGNSFDWNRTVETYDPGYYKWTQWIFTQLFKAGLAYRKTAEVNWCPSCKTVLSDEQVIDGCCERCGTKVEKKNLEQWFFRITNYAERLLENIKTLDWSEKVLIAQRNWIGKSEGLIFRAPIKDTKLYIDTFSVHFEAFYADTFVVIAPDHPFLEKLLEDVPNRKEIEDFCKDLLEKRKNEKPGKEKEPEGIFTGRYIVDPAGNGDLPIWVANYALKDYGTGIVKCSAHDVRDFAFANKYGIRLKPVLFPEDLMEKGRVEKLEICYTDMKNGVLSEPEEFKGKKAGEIREEIIAHAESRGLAKPHATYHLRDWLISRQRYWGPPIPMIFCSNCQKTGKGEREDMPGWYTVPETELPVLLPNVEDWRPMGTGLSPLANHPEFYNVKCPGCGGAAKRETDVSDTFLDSAWYFLRYPSADVEKYAFDTVRTKKWLPVNKYIGGAEHSVLHLLYARFVTMVLFDLKLIDFEEPFPSFFAHGLIIKDGAKMSKSRGNVVIPDTYITKYGADTLRTYLMFLGPYTDGGDFRDSGIEGMNRFIKRVWTLLTTKVTDVPMSEASLRMMHKTIKKVTEDISTFHYNTAISSLMEWYNFLSGQLTKDEAETFLKLLAPFAPYLTEELYQGFKNQEARIKKHEENNHDSSFTIHDSIHLQEWPVFEEKYLISDTIVVVVQVNGKKRGEMTIQQSELENRERLESQAQEIAKSHLENKEIKRIIHVPGKIINFVI